MRGIRVQMDRSREGPDKTDKADQQMCLNNK